MKLRRQSARPVAAVLMEVLLALALFVAAAAVATSALNSAMESLERQKLGLHALNLASSTLAELQLGIRPLTPQSVQPLTAPFQDWAWELALAPLENEGSEESPAGSGLVRAEVVIRHSTKPIVQRLSQVMKPRPVATNAPAGAGIP